MKKLEDIFNTNNFFEISEGYVTFWGMDIESRRLKTTPYVKNLIYKYDFPEDEIIELFEKDSCDFFKLVYTLKSKNKLGRKNATPTKSNE